MFLTITLRLNKKLMNDDNETNQTNLRFRRGFFASLPILIRIKMKKLSLFKRPFLRRVFQFSRYSTFRIMNRSSQSLGLKQVAVSKTIPQWLRYRHRWLKRLQPEVTEGDQ